MNANGIMLKKSKATVSETMNRLAESVTAAGAKIYVRIDQQAEALRNGIRLDPLEFMLFGNPERGTRLMAADPLIALDLPLKIICWQNPDGETMIAFNDYEYLTTRFAISMAAGTPLNLEPMVDSTLNAIIL